MYIYSEMPKWVGVFEKYFSTYIYSMSYKGKYFGICRHFFSDVPLFKKVEHLEKANYVNYM